MKYHGLPGKQGLYDPVFEHDACGIGLLANIKGVKSHEIVSDALEILCRLKHRGGQGSDPTSGDGAGILTQIPHKLFAQECAASGIPLPEAGGYGVGMLFLPQDEATRAACEQTIEKVVHAEGMSVLYWRHVPVDDRVLGPSARAAKPYVRQVFIAQAVGTALPDEIVLERKLYAIRKQAEKALGAIDFSAGGTAYFASLSCRTIVYKGLLLPEHLAVFYTDLAQPSYEAALALVHSRFSTNTFPSWERAHPYRYMIHNGEINTIKGNVNWMRAREVGMASSAYADIDKVRPIVDENGSDSSMFDNVLEFLLLSGRTLPHAVMMMIPEPWLKDKSMDADKRAFYEYHSCLMEAWDGPAAVAFTDGKRIGASLDRNGLRPARYYVTSDDRIIMSSEVGVFDLPPEMIVRKDRLRPGQMLLVDTEQGRIVPDEEIKQQIAEARPYGEWLKGRILNVGDLTLGRVARKAAPLDLDALQRRQLAFGFTNEEWNKVLMPLALNGEDPVGSMGYDAPLAILSKRSQLLYNYFKQMFAQVTNPPIDASLEEMITSVETLLGGEFPLLEHNPSESRRIRLATPIIGNADLAAIACNATPGLKAVTLPMLFKASAGGQGLEVALDELFAAADRAVADGAAILILSDRGMNRELAAIPALLATAGLHHHLIRSGTRTKVGIAVESGEPREVHHHAALLSYGANAINPYLTFESLASLIDRGDIAVSYEDAVYRYIAGVTKGILKVLSKMGISTIQSYIGAQIVEAIGIRKDVIDRYFTSTPSRLGGIGLDVIAAETAARHAHAYADEAAAVLESGDDFQWRKNGEEHLFSPKTIHTLQHACRENDYKQFKRYSKLLNDENETSCTIRGLLDIKSNRAAVSLDKVEPAESILRRFKTGAMSYGSISKEAHEALAIAMNRIGGKSNSGEGGEDPERYVVDRNGDSRSSAIKQVASGRFGVTSEYLIHASELQIKMAQGAKPGEGGQLPGHKVYPWIARARGSTTGVELISPPPHHDIYSIEDLAELIYDLRNANPNARINVKLVSEAGVGTIAAGVAKAQADVILISGFDGGTGAASRTSIKHAGIPWEIGLAEAHQTLVVNGLRDRVRLETDGKLMTGRDVVVAAMLGAQEFGFATVPLVVLGCVMMRVCHLDTCPVGIATQNPELRAKFAGDPQHIVNFMRFIAEEVRETLAELGFRSLDEIVGRTDLLAMKQVGEHPKAAALDFSLLLHRVDVPATGHVVRIVDPLDRGLDDTLDRRVILPHVQTALTTGASVEAAFPITNTDRAVGTLLGSQITSRYGAEGLPEDTIKLRFSGSAGQSFGAFVPKGITMTLEGDANDHVGKGLSGGKIVIYPPKTSPFASESNIILGNVALYGATSGEAYFSGVAGERFCVRNSGASVVVEGVGNHGCEYMTGGRVVVLGGIGQNFAAGMSGGIAYVLGESLEAVRRQCNEKLVLFESLSDYDEMEIVRGMIERHVQYTGSKHAQAILDGWNEAIARIVRIVPRDYMHMITSIDRYKKNGKSLEEAQMAAFQDRKQALSK